MAKPGVAAESDPTVAAAKAMELKKELQRLVKFIVDDEDSAIIEAIDKAKETLRELKDLKLRKKSSSTSKSSSSSLSFKLHENLSSCPQEFRCPLSKELMTDPVILASGQVSESRFFFLFGFSENVEENKDDICFYYFSLFVWISRIFPA